MSRWRTRYTKYSGRSRCSAAVSLVVMSSKAVCRLSITSTGRSEVRLAMVKQCVTEPLATDYGVRRKNKTHAAEHLQEEIQEEIE